MGKTIRCDKVRKGKRMKPYMREDIPFKGKHIRGEHHSYPDGESMGNTRSQYKEGVRNANRSMKKGIRQELERDVLSELMDMVEE